MNISTTESWFWDVSEAKSLFRLWYSRQKLQIHQITKCKNKYLVAKHVDSIYISPDLVPRTFRVSWDTSELENISSWSYREALPTRVNGFGTVGGPMVRLTEPMLHARPCIHIYMRRATCLSSAKTETKGGGESFACFFWYNLNSNIPTHMAHYFEMEESFHRECRIMSHAMVSCLAV